MVAVSLVFAHPPQYYPQQAITFFRSGNKQGHCCRHYNLPNLSPLLMESRSH